MEVVLVGVCVWVCGSRAHGQQGPRKRPQEKFEEGDTQLDQREQPYFIWKETQRAQKKGVKGEGNLGVQLKWINFPRDKAQLKVDKHVTNPGNSQGQRGGSGEMGAGQRREVVCCARTTGWRWVSPTISGLLCGSSGSYIMTTLKDLPKITTSPAADNHK